MASALHRLVVAGGGRHGLRLCSTASPAPITFDKYQSLRVTRPAAFVVHVELNRPKTRNSLSHELWK